MARLAWGVATDPGRIRPENEDNVLADQRAFVVADGMGGHRAGEVAAAITIDLLRSRLSAPGATLEDVVAAIADANTDIFRAANDNPDQHGMGTTVTGVVLIDEPTDVDAGPTADDGTGNDTDSDDDTAGADDDTDAVAAEPTTDESDTADTTEVPATSAVPSWALVNVGDSRTYLLRHGRLRRVTLDHSYVQELVTTGHITDEEARTHPRRNIVTRALGIDPSVRVDAWRLPLVRDDRFLVCSDGLSDEVADDEIVDVLRTIGDPQTAADELVRRANDHGGRDNVTVIVVDVLEGAEPPDPDDELDLEPAWEDGTDTGSWAVDDPDSGATEFDDLAVLVSGDAETAAGVPVPAGTDGKDAPDATTKAPRRRRRRVTGFIGGLALVAVLLLAFVIAAAWARRGYYVAFDADDEVFIYRGQTDGFLWFDPTVEAATGLSRDELDEASINRVERQQRFGSREGVEDFVADQLDTTTTTTTTTVPPTTTTTTTTTTTSTTSTSVAATTTTSG